MCNRAWAAAGIAASYGLMCLYLTRRHRPDGGALSHDVMTEDGWRLKLFEYH